jgi:hypothetical protein
MTGYTEATQLITGTADSRPLQNEDTRVWLKQCGFDLSRHLSWEDRIGDDGVHRYFRQMVPVAKPVEQWR